MKSLRVRRAQIFGLSALVSLLTTGTDSFANDCRASFFWSELTDSSIQMDQAQRDYNSYSFSSTTLRNLAKQRLERAANHLGFEIQAAPNEVDHYCIEEAANFLNDKTLSSSFGSTLQQAYRQLTVQSYNQAREFLLAQIQELVESSTLSEIDEEARRNYQAFFRASPNSVKQNYYRDQANTWYSWFPHRLQQEARQVRPRDYTSLERLVVLYYGKFFRESPNSIPQSGYRNATVEAAKLATEKARFWFGQLPERDLVVLLQQYIDQANRASFGSLLQNYYRGIQNVLREILESGPVIEPPRPPRPQPPRPQPPRPQPPRPPVVTPPPGVSVEWNAPKLRENGNYNVAFFVAKEDKNRVQSVHLEYGNGNVITTLNPDGTGDRGRKRFVKKNVAVDASRQVFAVVRFDQNRTQRQRIQF